MRISIAQVKAARSLLGWSQKDLSIKSGVPLQIIQNIDAGRKKSPAQDEWDAVTETIENAGIEFIECDGVRRKQEYIKKFKGSAGFKEFMEMVYEEANKNGGNFCIYNASPSKWKLLVNDDWNKMHIARMTEVFKRGNLHFRITCPYSDANFMGRDYAEYRYIPNEKWNERSFYIFGQYVAILIFNKKDVEIILFRDRIVADTFLDIFNTIWNTIEALPIDNKYR